MNLRDRLEARTAIITAFLQQQGGAAKMTDIGAELAQHGHTLSRDGVRRLLRQLPSVKMKGHGYTSRWQLRKPKADFAALDRHKQATEAQPTEPLSDWAANKARRTAKAEQIVAILRDHGAPMTIAELGAAAKEKGIDSLQGIIGLVRAGRLGARGKPHSGKRTYRYLEAGTT
jgi:Fe2+ or Zn2+ uptake regulation protein